MDIRGKLMKVGTRIVHHFNILTLAHVYFTTFANGEGRIDVTKPRSILNKMACCHDRKFATHSNPEGDIALIGKTA